MDALKSVNTFLWCERWHKWKNGSASKLRSNGEDKKDIGSSAMGGSRHRICPSDKYSSRNAAYWILSVGSRLKRLSMPLNRSSNCLTRIVNYLTFALWPEAWLYIYSENFETRCPKSNARKYFPPLCNCPIAQRCRPFARHDWHVRVIPHGRVKWVNLWGGRYGTAQTTKIHPSPCFLENWVLI